MPTSLYRFYASDDALLYVGQSRNPFMRLSGHFADKNMELVRHIELEWFETTAEALRAEAWAIRRENPLWNVVCPEKPRSPRVTPVAAQMRAPQPRPAPIKREEPPRCYSDMGPHLPPVQGPPVPYRRYAVDLEEVAGVLFDHVFTGGEDALKRAFKVARRGDVVHMRAGVAPLFFSNMETAPYVQFH